MRWGGFIVLAAVATCVQMSLGAVLRIPLGGTGLSLAVDFMAIVAVMVALRARGTADAALAAWSLGMLIDLTTSGMPLGLYALTFAAAGAMICQMREALFTDNPLTQMVLALLFCLVAHMTARAFANLYVRGGGAPLGRELLQAVIVAVCTAVCMPIVGRLLRPLEPLIMLRSTGRQR